MMMCVGKVRADQGGLRIDKPWRNVGELFSARRRHFVGVGWIRKRQCLCFGSYVQSVRPRHHLVRTHCSRERVRFARIGNNGR